MRAIVIAILFLGIATGAEEFATVDINGSFTHVDADGHPAGWTLPSAATIHEKALTISLAESGRAWATRRVDIDPSWKRIRLSADATAKDLAGITKEQPWSGAVLRYKFLRSGGDDLGPWSYPMLRASATGVHLEVTAEIPADAVALLITPGLADCSGSITFSGLSLATATTP